MRLFDYLLMAWRNLTRQKARTFLTILAVVIGATSVTIMLSIVVGAKQTLYKQLQDMGALTQISVSPSNVIDTQDPSSTLGTKLDDALVTKLSALTHVTAASPATNVWNFEAMGLKGESKKIRPQLSAYVPQAAFDPKLVAGRQLIPTDEAAVVLSGDDARSLGYASHPADLIGKTLVFTTKGGYTGYGVTDIPKPPQGNGNDSWWKDQQKVAHEVEAQIVGVATSGIGGGSSQVTMRWAHTVMTDKNWQQDQAAMEAAKKTNKPFDGSQYLILVANDQIVQNGYGTILLKVDDSTNVAGVAAEVTKLGLGAATAQDTLDQMTKIFTLVGVVLGIIGGISLFVAMIGIINTMVMSILERTREIGVMRACGATRATVRRLFTFEAGFLGLAGGLIGIGLSYLLAQGGNYLVGRFAASQSIDIKSILTFPTWLVVGVVVFTTIIGWLAGLYPAYKAARLNPVEALRYE